MSVMERFDVIGLGAGSAGAAMARRLAEAGHSVALVEAGRVGGYCPFVACMPSKAMLRSAQVRALLGRGEELGATGMGAVSATGAVAAFERAVQRRDGVVDHRDDAGKAAGLEDLGIRILRGRGRIIGPGFVSVEGVEYEWSDLVVGTGSSPIRPAIEGLDAVPTWTSDEALSSSDRPGSMAVLGGGAVGCELAQVFARFGTRVTLVESASRLLGPEEPSISARLADALKADGVDVRLGARAIRAKGGTDRTRLHLDSGDILDCERILLAVGRSPSTGDIGLEALGIEVDGGALAVDDTCRVRGQDRGWAAGDVTAAAGAPFTHTANYQAEIIAANILSDPGTTQRRADYRAIPRAVYTDPAVASVGMDAESAAAKGINVLTADVDLSEVARASADGDGGRLVLTADRSRSVLIGAAAIGPHADEWIGEAVLAIHAEISLAVLERLVHLFPTYSEAYGPLFRELASAGSAP